MNIFSKRLRNNKGDAQPLFFIWGLLIVLLLLWFAMDLITMTWARYTVKRESQTISRVYALQWINGVWNPDCEENVQSKCEYNTLAESKLAKDMIRIVDSTMSNGRFSSFTVVISNNQTTGIQGCDTAVMCLKNSGHGTTISGWGPSMLKNNLDYGTDLYIWVYAKTPFRFVGKRIGLEDQQYLVYNKFASERFSKNDKGEG